MNSPKLSIIVPIYNVETYLHTCIISILQQSFTDFELILVNDGSPDRCGKLCDEYAKEDNRIIVIHKENGGVSSARNMGLDVAKGEYITFIDPDDEYGATTTIEENIQILLEDDSIDMIQFPTVHIDINGDIISTHTPKDEDKNKILFLNEEKYLRYVYGTMSVNVWNKIYKKHLFSILRFPVAKIGEDIILTLDLSDKVQKIVFSDRSFYNYYDRKGSAMNSKQSRKSILLIIEAEILICKKFAKYPSLSRFHIFRYSSNIPRIREFQRKYDISEIVSKYYSIRPSLISMLLSLFAPKPRHLVRHIASIMLFAMHMLFAQKQRK